MTNPLQAATDTAIQKLEQKVQLLKLLKDAVFGLSKFFCKEIKRGRFITDLKMITTGEPYDISWKDLFEESAADVPSKIFLFYKDEKITYKQMDENANKVAHFLLKSGGGKGKGVGIYMRNSPRFLDTFFASQKIGMYSVPINPELKGDGLAYVINHSDINSLFIDAELLDSVKAISDKFEKLKNGDIIVNDIEEEANGISIPEDLQRLSTAYDMSGENPGIGYNKDDICLIIYTSGTTGPPKGVVYRYNNTGVLRIASGAHILLNKDDVYYTYLALCHGNALFITITMSLSVRCTVALSRKFSASRFCDTLRRYNATIFNTIGSIIPILMKQPEKPTDNKNKVRFVLSAACPAEMWDAFENRFGVKLYEGYGAVDGGGKGIMNLGTGPVGSLGKPPNQKSVRVVDKSGNDVPEGIPGELLFKMSGKKSRVEYYKNKEATQKKSKDGWLHTGDLVKRDKDGYLYFVGRNTESMRKGGENVSAYEVEHVIMQHPAVEDVAVYAVPSELTEDEIIAAVKLVEGERIPPEQLRTFLLDKLAKYALPRYIRYVDEFPKTNTHRIIKRILEQEGVTGDTYDAMIDRGKDSTADLKRDSIKNSN